MLLLLLFFPPLNSVTISSSLLSTFVSDVNNSGFSLS